MSVGWLYVKQLAYDKWGAWAIVGKNQIWVVLQLIVSNVLVITSRTQWGVKLCSCLLFFAWSRALHCIHTGSAWHAWILLGTWAHQMVEMLS